MVLLIPNLIHLISHPYNQSEKTIEIQHFIDDDLGLDVTSLDRDWRNLGLPAEGLYQVRHAYIRALVLVLRAAFEEEKNRNFYSPKNPRLPPAETSPGAVGGICWSPAVNPPSLSPFLTPVSGEHDAVPRHGRLLLFQPQEQSQGVLRQFRHYFGPFLTDF